MQMTQVYATIHSVLPRQVDGNNHDLVQQRLLLKDVTSVRSKTQVSPRVVLNVNTLPSTVIPFAIGDPITVFGNYDPSTNNTVRLPSITFTHGQDHYIRYKGHVYT